jgi:hypothetical protein
MPGEPPPTTGGDLRARLERASKLLGTTTHLDPQTRMALAQLLSELSQQVSKAAIDPQAKEHLDASAGHLLEALSRPHDKGILAAARERLDQAAMAMETQAPLAAGIARRLLDALANLGI